MSTIRWGKSRHGIGGKRYLFPPTDLEEDLEAGFMGLPFTQPETEHEWEDQVNCSTGTSELERETVD